MSAPILLAIRLLILLILYVFLGWALYTLWRNLKLSGDDSSKDLIPAMILEVEEPAGGFNTYRYSQPQVSIGRDPVSDICIDDKTISARHAIFTYQLGQWWLEDLKSTNGTSLNREPVTEPVVVTDGDELRCGKILIIVKM